MSAPAPSPSDRPDSDPDPDPDPESPGPARPGLVAALRIGVGQPEAPGERVHTAADEVTADTLTP